MLGKSFLIIKKDLESFLRAFGVIRRSSFDWTQISTKMDLILQSSIELQFINKFQTH